MSNSKVSNSIFSTFIPRFFVRGNDWDFIGSRRYMRSRPKSSDYDYMFRSQHREAILAHLDQIGIQYVDSAVGSIKFTVHTPGECGWGIGESFVINFCFVEDFEAWQKATELFEAFQKFAPCLGSLTKKARMQMFGQTVQAFGGKRPVFPEFTS